MVRYSVRSERAGIHLHLYVVDFATYIEKEEVGKPPKYRFTGKAKEALKDYYDLVHTLSQAQTNFASSTQVLEKKITDKSVFLDIIRQTQLPAVQVSVS